MGQEFSQEEEYTAADHYNAGAMFLQNSRLNRGLHPFESRLLTLAIERLTLAIDMAKYPPQTKREVAEWHSTLAEAWKHKGDRAKAVEHYLASYHLQTAEPFVNKDQAHECVETLHLMAGLCVWLKQYDKAIEYSEKAIEMVKTSGHGPLHPQMAAGYKHLGSTYIRKGELPKGIGYLKMALEILEADDSPWPTDHSNIAGVYLDIGNIYLHSGTFDKAVEFYNAAASHHDPDYHLGMYACHVGLTACYTRQGDLDAAHNQLRKALHEVRGAYGEVHEDTAFVYHRLAVTARDRKNAPDLKLALEYAQKATKIAFQILGPSSAEAVEYAELEKELTAAVKN